MGSRRATRRRIGLVGATPAPACGPFPTRAMAIQGGDLLQVTFTFDLYSKYTLIDRDLRTGHIRWKAALHGAAARVAVLAASPTQVYLLGQSSSTSTKGTVHAYARSNGKASWTLDAPTSLFVPPATSATGMLLTELDAGNACPA